MKKLMHFLAKLFPNSATGENPAAVKMFYRMTSIKEFFKGTKKQKDNSWPIYSGNYEVVNYDGHIALCTLTSNNLITQELFIKNIAVIGSLITPNLGIERLILNIISNPNIQYLLLCGKDSPIFKAGQALEYLFAYGIDQNKRIIKAEGHFPVLRNLSEEDINHFRTQVHLIYIKEEKSIAVIQQKIKELDFSMQPYQSVKNNLGKMSEEKTFIKIKPGGKRIPLDYDNKGFFVITTHHEKKEITVKHYYATNDPGFIIKGHSAESILLAILNNELVSQMSHAGYLGAELAKAETALKLNLIYTQDQSLKLNSK